MAGEASNAAFHDFAGLNEAPILPVVDISQGDTSLLGLDGNMMTGGAQNMDNSMMAIQQIDPDKDTSQIEMNRS